MDQEPHPLLVLRENVWTVNDLLSSLEEAHDDDTINFDFCSARPTGLISWRGDYQQLAITYCMGYDDDVLHVGDLRSRLKLAKSGHVFEGYKGGMYRMKGSTSLWVDNYGEYHTTGVVGLYQEHPRSHIILTSFIDTWV